MITNTTVTINEKAYKAYVFTQNKITADDMGEKFDCTVTVRVPIARREKIDIDLGGYIVLNGEKWKIAKLNVNRTGRNPHYHLVGVK